jgi:hypothetical protein
MSIIRTKHVPATDYKGAGVRAKLGREGITLSYDYGLSGIENHKLAAEALARKLNLLGDWKRVWDGTQKEGWTFVCINITTDGFTVERQEECTQ